MLFPRLRSEKEAPSERDKSKYLANRQFVVDLGAISAYKRL